MINYVALMGRICKEVELKQTQSGIPYCKFSIAVDQKFKNKETNKYDCDFIEVQAWRGTAEFIARYMASKGTMIAIEGSLRQNNYTDSNGTKHYSYVVQVDQAHFCGGKSESAQSGTQQTGTTQGDIEKFVEQIEAGDVEPPPF